MAESSAIQSPVVPWKVETVPNKLGDLAKEISRQSIEGASWLLAAHRNIGEETNPLLNNKECVLLGLKILASPDGK